MAAVMLIGRLLWWLFSWLYGPGVSAGVLDDLEVLLATEGLL